MRRKRIVIGLGILLLAALLVAATRVPLTDSDGGEILSVSMATSRDDQEFYREEVTSKRRDRAIHLATHGDDRTVVILYESGGCRGNPRLPRRVSADYEEGIIVLNLDIRAGLIPWGFSDACARLNRLKMRLDEQVAGRVIEVRNPYLERPA